MDTNQLKAVVIAVEKNYAKYVGNEVEAMRDAGGDRLANEMLASVAALFCARAIGILHVWTAEPIDSIRKRVIESIDAQLKPTIDKLIKDFETGRKS